MGYSIPTSIKLVKLGDDVIIIDDMPYVNVNTILFVRAGKAYYNTSTHKIKLTGV